MDPGGGGGAMLSEVGEAWAGLKAHWHFLIIQNNSNEFELFWLKSELPVLENFKIKYEFEVFEERNNFLHRNFFRFKLDFEWKIREASRFKLKRIW
jgi:hypothetical protein